MKPILFCILSLLTLKAGLAQVDLTVGSINASPGSRILVPVLISQGQDITAIQFVLSYDPAVLSVPEQEAVLPGDSLVDHTVGSSSEEALVRAVIFSGSLTELKAGPGSLIMVVFQVASDAPAGGSTLIDALEIQASDTDGQAIPVSGIAGEVTLNEEANSPQDGENQLVFPQIANGTFGGGHFQVTLIFVNRTDIASSGRIRLFKSDGTALSVSLIDASFGSIFEFTVPANGSVFLQTDGSGALAAGYAVLDATVPLGGTLLFSLVDPAGNVVTEAGVGGSPIGERFSIPILTAAGSDTGIAFANITSSVVEVTLILRDEAGVELERSMLELLPGEHLPRFATELFEELAAGELFQGAVEMIGSGPISAVALKQHGILLTTFPVLRPVL